MVRDPGEDACQQCGQVPVYIAEEVSEELEPVPARLEVRRTVRRKYACRCGCGGVHIAPLPPRLLPQSKLGPALAVHLLLARFDDHVAYYTLERIFRERHDVVVPRQRMVQWVEHIASLSQPLCRSMFQEMKQGGYLQVDEMPVRVMDPEVKGKCARASKATKSDSDGEATDRLPTTLDDLEETKGGFVAFHFLTGKDKDAIAQDLAASFMLTEPQVAKIVRRITGRVRLHARVFDLVPARKQTMLTAPRRPSASPRGFFVSKRVSQTAAKTSENRPRRCHSTAAASSI